MIIDSHVHLIGEGWVHPDFMLGMAKMATALAGYGDGARRDGARAGQTCHRARNQRT